MLKPLDPGNLKSMSRFIFAALLGVVARATAGCQEVPGRDLLAFPLGALAGPRPIAETSIGGFWNPASGTVPAGMRAEVLVSALTTPIELGISGQVISASAVNRRHFTTTLSFARAAVTDIIRTETDPQSMGEIPYQTTVLTAGVSRPWRSLIVGASARYRRGTLADESRGVIATDVGVVADRLLGSPIRVAASTFMLSPFQRHEAATILGAIDAPVLKRDSSLVARVGYAFTGTQRREREHFVYTTIRWARVDLQGGMARVEQFGHDVDAMRLGLGLRYARYRVAIAREDGSVFGASYHFLLSSSIR